MNSGDFVMLGILASKWVAIAVIYVHARRTDTR